MTAEAYPLQWPDGWPRAKFHRESDRRFGSSRITEDAEGMIMRGARKLTQGTDADEHLVGATCELAEALEDLGCQLN